VFDVSYLRSRGISEPLLYVFKVYLNYKLTIWEFVGSRVLIELRDFSIDPRLD
jgi:hypothetical protein